MLRNIACDGTSVHQPTSTSADLGAQLRLRAQLADQYEIDRLAWHCAGVRP
jgi:hypothetical protein